MYFILFGMPRGILSKVDMLARVYKLKNLVHSRQGKYSQYDDSQLHVANETLNDILDMLGEYSQ